MSLEDELWVLAATDASVALLNAISDAQVPLPGLSRAAEVAELVTIMKDASWYQDGVDEAEMLAAAGVFKKSRDLAITLYFAGNARLRPIEKLDWTPLLQKILRSGLFSTHVQPEGRALSILTTSVDGLEAESIDAQRIADQHVGEVVRLAGELKSSSVLQVIATEVIDEGRVFCGQASYELGITLIAHGCVTENTVIHELVHHATSDSRAVWYEEGTASWVADYLTKSLRRHDESKPEIDMLGPTFRENNPGGGINARYQEDAAAGFKFYLDLERLIGASAVSSSIRAVREGALGSQVIEAILASTPAEMKATVKDLYLARCRTGQPDYLRACAIPP